MGLDPYDLAFGVGLELELLVTVPAEDVEELRSHGPIPFGSVHAATATGVFHRDGAALYPALPGKRWESTSGDPRDFVVRKTSS